MKKKITFLSIALFMFLLVGCAGAADYEIELINGFKVVRSSAEKICIGSPDYSYDKVLVPLYTNYEEGEYVIQVGHDKERYIISKTNLDNYYILDTKDVLVSGPFDKEKFDITKEKIGIPESVELKDLDEYRKIN